MNTKKQSLIEIHVQLIWQVRGIEITRKRWGSAEFKRKEVPTFHRYSVFSI